MVVHLNGRFVDEAEATVSLLDRSYLLGEGAFATMRGYAGRCFRSGTHLANLARAAALFDVTLPDGLADVADEAARRTGAEDAYVRVTASSTAVSVIARPMDVPPADAYARGVDVVTVPLRRIPPACFDGTMKTTSYAPSTLARRAAGRAFEGLQLAIDGSVACATMANVFAVVGRELLTPGLASGCRTGVTRGVVLELAPSVGLLPREVVLAPETLLEADEVFLTSTRLECLGVASIDGAPRPDARPYTHALRAALRALAL